MSWESEGVFMEIDCILSISLLIIENGEYPH